MSLLICSCAFAVARDHAIRPLFEKLLSPALLFLPLTIKHNKQLLFVACAGR